MNGGRFQNFMCSAIFACMFFLWDVFTSLFPAYLFFFSLFNFTYIPRNVSVVSGVCEHRLALLNVSMCVREAAVSAALLCLWAAKYLSPPFLLLAPSPRLQCGEHLQEERTHTPQLQKMLKESTLQGRCSHVQVQKWLVLFLSAGSLVIRKIQLQSLMRVSTKKQKQSKEQTENVWTNEE